MYAEDAQEGQQHPCHRVIGAASCVTGVCIPVHGRNKEEIDDPAYEKQAQREESDGARNLAAVIKPVGAHEAENPEDIADCFAMRIVIHPCSLLVY